MILDGTILNADINASAAIVDTKLDTIATAGKVSNSATTAASANTASAIVARDASGNFTAGTITAALTGSASSNVLKAGDTMTGVLAVTAGTAALPGIAVSGDLNTGIYSPGADQLAIATGGTGQLFVNATGLVTLAGPGIKFPATQVASTDANALDDYEEGTWTPTQGAGLTVVGAFASSGHYTKVGRQVTIQGYVGAATSVSAATNQVLCGGLPFVAKSAANAQCIGSAANGTTINALINVLVNQGSSDVYAVTTMAATIAIYFTVSYLT
jgi:hypothetical protein